MVKHIVLWKIRDNDDKQKNIDKMIQMLTPLVGKIEGLVNLEVGYNFNTGSEYDVVLYAVFKNPVALKYYQNHPEHVKCKEFIGSITVDRTAADYFYDEETASSLPLSKVKDVPEQKIAQSVKEVKAEPVVPVAEPKPVAPKAEPVKDEIEVTPVDQRSDSWTCPNCGKVMPNYVGTCGCGEPKPFVFDEVPPAMQPAPTAQPKPVAPAPKAEPVKEEKPSFFKKAEPTPVSAAPTNDSWTCTNCGKVMPNYVGTCGCGEPKPFVFDDVSPAMQPAPTVQPKPVAPAPKAEPVKEEKPSFFKKAEPTPAPAPTTSANTWTCPNCGKVMPNYVGTCGCGEPKPFVFDEVPPAMQPAPTVQPKPVAPAPKTEPVKQEKPSFFKKAEPTPVSAAPTNDSWTCPNCGKVMKNYISTCTCGEPKPFVFDDVSPATQSAPTAQPKPVAPAPKAEPVKEEKPSFFGKKKPEIEVTPVDQRSDSWTCPNCGKVMPNYVGTCGCGEPKPFVFDEVPPAMQPAPTAQPKPVAPAPKAEPAPLPNIAPEEKSAQKMTYEDVQKFNDVEPSLQSYNPQIKQPAAPVDNAPNLGFIQNDEEPSTNSNDYDGFHFDDIPPAAPMRFNDASPMSDRFNQNNNIDVKPMRFDDIPPAAPMKFSDQSQESVAPPAPAKPEKKKSIFTTEISVGKRNKHLFGKKAKEEEVFRQAQEKVNSRKDVPNSGTWTCPNCGKVMPAYVGTCGCGESKPFEF